MVSVDQVPADAEGVEVSTGAHQADVPPGDTGARTADEEGGRPPVRASDLSVIAVIAGGVAVVDALIGLGTFVGGGSGLGLVALITGIVALVRNGGGRPDAAPAIAGIVLGVAAVGVSALMWFSPFGDPFGMDDEVHEGPGSAELTVGDLEVEVSLDECRVDSWGEGVEASGHAVLDGDEVGVRIHTSDFGMATTVVLTDGDELRHAWQFDQLSWAPTRSGEVRLGGPARDIVTGDESGGRLNIRCGEG